MVLVLGAQYNRGNGSAVERYWGVGDIRFGVIATGLGGAHFEQDDKFHTD